MALPIIVAEFDQYGVFIELFDDSPDLTASEVFLRPIRPRGWSGFRQ